MISFLLFVTIRILQAFIFVLPNYIVLRLARAFGSILYFLDKRHRNISLTNLKNAFPDMSDCERTKITKGVFRHLGEMIVETPIMSWLNKDEFLDSFEVSGVEYFREVQEKTGNGCAFFMTGHFGNWELLSTFGGASSYISAVLARSIPDRRINSFVDSIRERFGVKVVHKGMNLRVMLNLVKNGEKIGILNDQDAGKNGAFISFMGRKASTHSGAIQLAYTKKIPIIPIFIKRIGPLRHNVILHKPVYPGSEGSPVNATEGLQYLADILAEHITETPEQWLWLHRRWKTRP